MNSAAGASNVVVAVDSGNVRPKTTAKQQIDLEVSILSICLFVFLYRSFFVFFLLY